MTISFMVINYKKIFLLGQSVKSCHWDFSIGLVTIHSGAVDNMCLTTLKIWLASHRRLSASANFTLVIALHSNNA